MSVRNIVCSLHFMWNNGVFGLNKNLTKSAARGLGMALKSLIRNVNYFSPTGNPGSGAGKGGGAGGSVRESGGGLGEYGTVQEEQFFFNKQREQLEKIKKKIKDIKSGDLTNKADK